MTGDWQDSAARRTARLLDQEAVIDEEMERLRRCRAVWRRVRTYPHPWREAALELVVQFIGDNRDAARWLVQPLQSPSYSPIELIETEEGAMRLQKLLQAGWRPDLLRQLTGKRTPDTL